MLICYLPKQCLTNNLVYMEMKLFHYESAHQGTILNSLWPNTVSLSILSTGIIITSALEFTLDLLDHLMFYSQSKIVVQTTL